MSVVVLVVLAGLLIVVAIGRIASHRNVPVITDTHDTETPTLDLMPIKAQIFDMLYYVVLVQHENGMQYLEARDRRSHRVIALVDESLQVELLQQQQQKKGA